MKRVPTLSLVLLLAFASTSFAILRPRYPAKAAPPDRGGWILIGDDAITHPPR